MSKSFKKIISIFTITLLLTFQTVNAFAMEIPTPPPEPTPPPTETQITRPPAAPTPPPVPTFESDSDKISQTETTSNQDSETNDNSDTQEPVTQNNQNKQSETNQSGQDVNGNVGDTEINTGDSLTTGTLTIETNSNISLQQPLVPTGNNFSVENTGNGSNSNNSAFSENESSTNIIQDNNADIGNDVDLNTNTGGSSASQNVGNSTITTGDANTSGTIVTTANTNSAGLAVSEFNIVDDTQGDIVLDFASGCILGCGIFDPVTVINSGNGNDSANTTSVDQTIDNNTFQNNDAALENNLTFTADSGNNQANKNTGGDTTITTGDANVAANVVNFLNNNIAGNVVLGVVNIFGDLIGDIILPEEELNTPLANASNTAYGTSSTNLALIDNDITNTTFQTNDAVIQNNLSFAANTGQNQTSKNTGGNSVIETGDTNIESQTINIANSNIDGGNWWLVLVNEAGTWIGNILGSTEGSSTAGSSGTQFVVNPNGDITVTNQDNGADSQNTASANQTINTNTVQNNVAQIINNLNLSANTGNNSASKNTGGDSTVKTGDANIVANLVNFVNNNIARAGRLTITIVNVFGSWMGDFVAPGQHKIANGDPDTNQDPTDPPTDLTQNPTQPANQVSGGVQTITQPSSSLSSNSLTAPVTINPAASSSISYTRAIDQQNLVAGTKIEHSKGSAAQILPATTQSANKTTELNLAWLLLLLPFGGVGAFMRFRKP